MKQKILLKWQSLKLKGKINFLVSAAFAMVGFSLLFEGWIVKFSLVDFYIILDSNAKSSELQAALEKESEYFADFIKEPDGDKKELLDKAIEETRTKVYALPFVYSKIGEERYAKTWSIRNSYEVYCRKRDELIALREEGPEYIKKLYAVYDMQDYLQEYADTLMTETLEAGSYDYREKVPALAMLPVLVILVGALLFWVIFQFVELLQRAIILPIMELVQASKKIAENDFYTEDIPVNSNDEMGELIHAFNKMKYATGEYIMGLEEKRKTLDLLHKEELQRLEVEKQLETTNLELLKNQINPHFLFNTLNVIGGMANLEGAETTEKMIKALSFIFRYNLKSQDAETTLTQEIQIVKDYMYLQEMRFGNRISYSIECELETDNYMIPTFTFQPLIENAVIHGLAKKEEGGTIFIKIWQEKENLLISIADTGVGMSAEKVEKIRGAYERQEKGEMGIGLGNLYKRIYGMYEAGQVEIFSCEGEGTTIRLTIPQKRGKEHMNVFNTDS